MAFDPSGITELQLDALREVGNIGAGHAATALADMLGEEIDITVPTAGLRRTDEIGASPDAAEVVVVGVLFVVAGNASGIIVYVFSEADARFLSDRLMGLDPETTQEIGEMERSMLGEIGNILSGSFVTALAEFTNLEFNLSPPTVAVDTLATILSEITVTAEALGELSLELDTRFVQQSGQLEGRFYYLMDRDSLSAILGALGMAG